ncbi:hypothetical protein [Kribbella sp. NPDC050459]|uniref:hypothetical protein n=1 Tax=Kribbella sp. NPDC050459 TaxID=3155785 RepID=UPI0033C8BEE8
MAFDVARFNSAFSAARYQQDTDRDFDLEAAQQKLRDLIADEPEGDDRDWAVRLIGKLAEPRPAPREWSALYYEAAAIQAAAYPGEGTDEEKAATIADARRKIWAIADRASQEEEAPIRAMTRSLEHIENELREPTWPRD